MICWFENHSNDVVSSVRFVFFTSTISSRFSGMYLNNENFRLYVPLYVSRRLSSRHDFKDHDDVYLAPNEKSEK
jgi:hypothetical protein